MKMLDKPRIRNKMKTLDKPRPLKMISEPEEG